MSTTYSPQEIFRRYLKSDQLSGHLRVIVELLVSGTLTRQSFDKLLEDEKFSISSSLKENLLDLALIFLRECIEDHEISADEMTQLQNLITIFRIKEGDFWQIRRVAIQELLTAQASRILDDRYVTKEEDLLQRDLQRVLGLSYDQYVSVLRPLAKTYIEELEIKKLGIQEVEELRLISSSIQNLRRIFLIAH